MQVYVKKAMKLTCPEVFGFPVPHVAWVYNGAVLQNSTTQLTLQLNSSLAQYNHNIDCVVTNKHGADFHQFQLETLSKLTRIFVFHRLICCQNRGIHTN